MKINYIFVNGETSEIEVEEEFGNIILDSRRREVLFGRLNLPEIITLF